MNRLAQFVTQYAKLYFAAAGIASTGTLGAAHEPVWTIVLTGAIYAASVWAAENKPKPPKPTP